MKIEARNNFQNLNNPNEEVKNQRQFGIASNIKDRFESAVTNQRATIFDAKMREVPQESPRSERMETINETRALLEKNMPQRSGFELPPELARIVDAFEGIQNSESKIPVIRIKELLQKYNDGQILMDDLRRAVERLIDESSNDQTSGEPIKNESMEFYLKVRDSLEAAIQSRQAE